MQYHFDGFRAGDPNKQPSSDKRNGSKEEVDVLIIGCGPAGLTLAAQLAAFDDINVRIVEQKSGPLEIGQADGIACRSMEMFEAFGFAEKVAKEAYWVNETTFWRPIGEDNRIARADRIQDVEDDLSEMPHTILSQARVHDFFLEQMLNSSQCLEPDYDLKLISLKRDDAREYPLPAVLESRDGLKEETISAKYVVGCDGARSSVRKSLGFELKGEASRQLWGVMDVLVATDFPDIRFKCAIQSADQGSILIIPREGGAMVRTYIELGELKDDERASDHNVTVDRLIDQARAVLAPHSFDVKEVAWCSAYEIGQRVCDQFDDRGSVNCSDGLPRIFIAGDACHTHSPKAGQGMNVSMADTFNLGWKLASVIRQQSTPELLKTYSDERQAKARELIEFDKDMARLFSTRTRDEKAASQFQKYFQKHGRYTAGVETRYDPSMIVSDNSQQELANGLRAGMRFHSAPVIRVADAKPLQLGHVMKADGRWRLIAFAASKDRGQKGKAISELCEYLENDTASPVKRFTPSGADIDSVIDLRAVFQKNHRNLTISDMPELLRPPKGRLQLTDYEKVFSPDLKDGPDIFDIRQIDRNNGALIIVRPDQFVAKVLSLTDYNSLANFFNGFMLSTS